MFIRARSSSPHVVIRSVLNGFITPLYNKEIIAEYSDVLNRNKFKFKPDDVENLISAITFFGLDTERTATDEYFQDIDDIVFYEIAMSVENAFLVTGNQKHFPRKPFVITPTQMVEILYSKGLL